jgi:hypothetical protein
MRIIFVIYMYDFPKLKIHGVAESEVVNMWINPEGIEVTTCANRKQEVQHVELNNLCTDN